jgi:spectinomycin phosphotransferase
MLEPPRLSIPDLVDCVQREYGMRVAQIEFLPLGADVNTAVFRMTANSAAWFLKLRSGAFEETSLTLPAFLHAHGNTHVIPIVATNEGNLWTQFAHYTVVLHPFVEGRDGFSVKLTPPQWRDFGAAFKHIHNAEVPASILQRIPIERYSPAARNAVLMTLNRIKSIHTSDRITQALISLLHAKRDAIIDLVARASRLAQALQSQSPAFVVCHGDIHAGNILVDQRDHLYIVDWDTLICAPKERDLMFFGGGQGFVGYTPDEEVALFFAGYGDAPVDQVALAYYRYERIVQDIAAFCDALLSSDGDGEDRRQSLKWLKGNFDAGGTIDLAYAADRSSVDHA